MDNDNSQLKILHFEDEELLREVYAIAFERVGLAYTAYEHPPAHPSELIDVVLRLNPNFIIMSIIMPVIDGLKAATIIKDDPRTKDIPLCFLSTCGQQKDINSAKELGAVGYMIKAKNTPSEVARRVKEFLMLAPISSKKQPRHSPKLKYHRPSLFDTSNQQESIKMKFEPMGAENDSGYSFITKTGEIFKNIINNHKLLLSVAIILFLVSGLFYWYQIRPSLIYKKCHSFAMKAAPKNDFDFFLLTRYDSYYKSCLRSRGINK